MLANGLGTTTPLVSLTAGGSFTCGLTGAGAAYCGGINAFGQLGTGAAEGAVQGGHVFSSVSAGNIHTCGVTVAGVAYCWRYNINGQLGDGTTTQRATPVVVTRPSWM